MKTISEALIKNWIGRKVRFVANGKVEYIKIVEAKVNYLGRRSYKIKDSRTDTLIDALPHTIDHIFKDVKPLYWLDEFRFAQVVVAALASYAILF